MVTDAIGLYVHIPFCKRKCNYCDFCSFASDSATYSEYTDALIKEIKSYGRDEKIAVDTVFFGGGTPTVLPTSLFRRIVDAIRESFNVSLSAEFTVEINPGAISEEKLIAYKQCGVNRISIGLQSIHENELKILGRIHSFGDFLETYQAVQAVGFSSVSLDLMYGIPLQTKESFEKTLDRVLELAPDHISCYGLIIEEGTPFFEKMHELPLPSEDEECDMYDIACRKLGAMYQHYEISNYAKSGFECRHNLKYWHDEEYIGVGLSAHSYFNCKRFCNTSVLSEYLSDHGVGDVRYLTDSEQKTDKDQFEYVMLRMRLSEGFSLSEYNTLFGVSFTEGREKLISVLSDAGYVKLENGRIFFTERGFYVSNSILSELL